MKNELLTAAISSVGTDKIFTINTTDKTVTANFDVDKFTKATPRFCTIKTLIETEIIISGGILFCAYGKNNDKDEFEIEQCIQSIYPPFYVGRAGKIENNQVMWEEWNSEIFPKDNEEQTDEESEQQTE